MEVCRHRPTSRTVPPVGDPATTWICTGRDHSGRRRGVTNRLGGPLPRLRPVGGGRACREDRGEHRHSNPPTMASHSATAKRAKRDHPVGPTARGRLRKHLTSQRPEASTAEFPPPTTYSRHAVTVTEQRTEQSTQSAPRQTPHEPTPTTRRVRPSVLYFLGRPAQVWVDALGHGRITIAP